MFGAFRSRRPVKAARYHFYVWEAGSYRSLSPYELPSDDAAADLARQHAGKSGFARPASLDAPHLHVVREDGIHIITVDLPASSEEFMPAREEMHLAD